MSKIGIACVTKISTSFSNKKSTTRARSQLWATDATTVFQDQLAVAIARLLKNFRHTPTTNKMNQFGPSITQTPGFNTGQQRLAMYAGMWQQKKTASQKKYENRVREATTPPDKSRLLDSTWMSKTPTQYCAKKMRAENGGWRSARQKKWHQRKAFR